MGKEKHGFLTPKAISNRIKAKGLQKLKWYCQMCQKQCRDENGFKCHLMSESHQRQLLLVSDNPSRFVDEFSKEFCESFIDDLRKQFGTRRVLANLVYQTYIAFRHHIHMNSTQWETLTQFVKWLGREGMCKVDETERGWYIAYIDRDPATIERQEKLKRKEKLDSDDSERTARYIDQQIERGALSSNVNESVQSYSDLIREGDDDKITFNVSTGSATCSNMYTDNKLSNPLSEPKSGESRMKLKRISGSSDSNKTKKKRMSSLDEIKLMEERRLEKENRKDYWLHEGIVVKIITKRLGEKYFNKKGVVTEVIDNYTGMIDILGLGDILKLNQIYVETVIPNIGKNVLIVNGAYRGNKARLVSNNSEAFSVDLELCEGLLTGKPVLSCEYEDVCKLLEQ